MKCSNETKRSILDKAGSTFFSVEFVKKDGSMRHMTCKKWIEAAYAHGSANAKPSPFANKPEYFLAVDMVKGEFRAIGLDRLKSCKVNGQSYNFDIDGETNDENV